MRCLLSHPVHPNYSLLGFRVYTTFVIANARSLALAKTRDRQVPPKHWGTPPQRRSTVTYWHACAAAARVRWRQTRRLRLKGRAEALGYAAAAAIHDKVAGSGSMRAMAPKSAANDKNLEPRHGGTPPQRRSTAM